VHDPQFQRVIGLANVPRREALADPVERIVHDRTSLKDARSLRAPLSLRVAYRLMRASRSVLPLRAAARVVRTAAARRSRSGASDMTNEHIAALLHRIEGGMRGADCYPRALMTAFLCLSAGRACTLLVGVLAPTRKMHTWCCIGGELPYEPLPEHYLYRPLWALTLSPLLSPRESRRKVALD
jgi:hypothetical protein